MLKMLVVRACGVGDFVLNLPALRALQETYKNMPFTLVGYPSTLELARDFISVDRIFSIESDPWRRLFYEPISGLDFESAVVWMKDPAVAENLRLSGVPDVRRADAFPQHGHAADHLLRTLGLPRPILPDFWSRTSNDAGVIVGAGSGNPRKNWSGFDELVRRRPGIRHIPQNLTLAQVAGLSKRCRAYVGNDSGITHLASYLGCPTIALFGPTDPRTWGPIGRRCRIIWKAKLEDISVDEVLLTLDSLWNARPNPS